MHRWLATALVAVLVAPAAPAAEREVIRTDWADFGKQAADRKLLGRSAHVRLQDGRAVKTAITGFNENSLVVRASRSTALWKTVDGKAEIPRGQVAAVRFSGKVKRHGLIGALAGLGAGAGVAAATVAQTGITEGPFVIILPIAGVAMAGIGALAGYYIGRAAGTPAPEFVIVP